MFYNIFIHIQIKKNYCLFNMSFHQRSEIKMNQFREDIKDEDVFEKKLIYLINIEFDSTLNDILLLEPESFINRIEKGIYLFYENLYSENCLSDQKLLSLIEKLIELKKIEYSNIAQILRNTWNFYTNKKEVKNDLILSNYRKHCINSSNIAKHNCGSQKANFILVRDKKNKINFVICESCKKVYYSSYINCHCDYCNIDYYSNILNENEDPNLMIATWEKYHCPQIINEKMKCIECHEILYINMKTGFLTCLNKNCNFSSDPNKIVWTCSVCQKDFKSNAIPYNPLEPKIVKNVIRQTLLLKHRAHPNNLPCCKLNVFFIEFFHKKICRGVLYEGELNDKMVIVCEKCHSINYYERFIWTCPKCLRKFIDKNNINNNIEEENIIRKRDYKNMFKKRSKYNSVGKDYLLKNYKKDISHIIENKKEENIEKQYIKKEIENQIKSNELQLGLDLVQKRNVYLRKNTEQDKSGCIKITINNESGKKINNFIINNNNISIYYSKYNNEKNNIKNPILRHLSSQQIINNIICEEKNEYKREKINKNHHKEHISIVKNRSSSVFTESQDENKLKDNYYQNINKQKDKPEENKKNLIHNKYNNLSKEKNFSIENIYHGKKDAPKKINLKMVKVEYNQHRRKYSSCDNIRDSESKPSENRIYYNEINHKYFPNKLEKNSLNIENEKMDTDKRKNKIRFHPNLNGSNRKNDNQNINIKLKKFINMKNEHDRNKKDIKNENSFYDKDEIKKKSSNNEIKIIQEYNNKNINNNYKETGFKDESIDDSEKNNNKENNKNNSNKLYITDNNKNTSQKNVLSIPDNIGLENLKGFSEKLTAHLKVRINFIFEKSKIPLFNIDDYIINRKLGEGSFGLIYSVFKKSEPFKEYALKKIIAKSITEVTTFIQEFELVYSCNHPNIMKIYGFCLRILDSTTFAIYVLMEKSIYDWDKEIKSHLSKRKFYTEKELIKILKQLCEALLFLKNNFNISHRDIKPQNILVFDNDIYKLADFGEAKEIKISKRLNTLRGTELYMSPVLYEGLKNDKINVNHDSFKSDVFSLGFCFLYAAGLNFNLLYHVRNITDNEVLENIVNNQLSRIYSKNFVSIVCLMLKIDEFKRFGFSEILEFINNNYK